jgi:glycosyltransferase involved in cell wall biosynthesis
MKPDISVVICTYNPRPDFLQRVLAVLKAQTLPPEQWELLLIDNASKEPLAKSFNLSWHPQGRHVREEELGLTAARLRGIKESNGDLLVFVDDDNVLQSDYLSECLTLAKNHPFIGALGGQVIPEYEVPPSEDIKPYLHYLLIRKFDEVKWSNLLNFHETSPCGAGMCIRREVVNNYLQLATTDARRKELDRKGESIFAGGDSDMALCSRRVGLGTGLFPSLRLVHLIPKSRLTRNFFLKAAFGGGYSFTLLDYLYGLRKSPIKEGMLRRSLSFVREARRSPFERQLSAEQQKGEARAWELIHKWQQQSPQ